jgi:isopentenyl-diphosphate delta-isomerase
MKKNREQRKEEHLNLALALGAGPKEAGFADVGFVHQALSMMASEEIDTSTEFLGKRLTAPLLIEAITGGTQRGLEINKCFAQAAAKAGIAMAVGSQTVAIEDKTKIKTFAVVREYNPDGVMLANVGAGVSPAVALKAVEMIKADGLQLHLNTVQELVMEEGDRNFKEIKKNIAEIVKASPVPVILKEVGFGMSRETVLELYSLGVKLIDVGGAGGTNFAAIENSRRAVSLSSDWHYWGIPTVTSLLEALDAKVPIFLVASGGIDNGIKAAKALALGAGLAGAATPFLRAIATSYDVNGLSDYIETWIQELKMVMILVNAGSLAQLQQKPLVIRGRTREWVEARGISRNSNLESRTSNLEQKTP